MILATGVFVSFIFIQYFLGKAKVDPGIAFIEQIRKDNKYGIDSLNKALEQENAMYNNIENYIKFENYKAAEVLIDSLILLGKVHMSHIYKGMIFEKQQFYNNAIKEFTSAIDLDQHSIGRVNRAEVYSKLGFHELAIKDYKHLTRFNPEYFLPLARSYEDARMKDSAIIYYQAHMKYKPEDSTTNEKLKVLTRSI